ncbi:hypothetical protein QTH89_22195 [Variovorax sp. J22G21]|uniref:hypothetical protein n=1 Tax=Variovorax fucosicus TaxID=3053517 RepID=UPI0025761C27|nr:MULTISPECIES: hypothetical protein [unclassified Variovorax]MDM0039163.1 hypothetical protein [Variovorax sp. J22R193]MDM0063939.1 hypothetical protein [Variovorax sp. J22G21]
MKTIAITLQTQAKETSWHDPTYLTPLVAFLVLVYSIWATRSNLQLSAENTTKQLDAAALNLGKQLTAAAATTDKQLKAAQEAADAKMAHDRDEANTNRLMEARRDIYVEILADYQKVQQFIGGLANPDAKFEERALLSIMSASVNKLWIWGEVESAYGVREFYTQVNEFYFVALARAEVIKELRESIAAFTKQLRKFEAETAQLGEELRAMRAQPQAQRMTPDWLNRENNVSREQRGSMRSEHQWVQLVNDLDAKLQRKVSEYLSFVIERQTALNGHVNEVMASARADIGLGGDLTKLNAQTVEMGERVRAALKKRSEVYQAEHQDAFGDENDADEY